MIDRDTMRRLIDEGRRKGRLETRDLRHVLPIERMEPDDIALVLLRLEEAGVAVELDEDLLARSAAAGASAWPHANAPELPVIDLPGTAAPRGEALSPAATPGLAAAPAATDDMQRPALRAAHWAVGAAAVLLALLVVVLLLSFY